MTENVLRCMGKGDGGYWGFRLGDRNFRHDVSNGCASGCAVQLAL